MSTPSSALAPTASASEGTRYSVLGAISFSHLLNDMMQSLMLAIYPLFKAGLHLNFAQVGLITLTYQITASILQPLVGLYTDRKPHPYSLSIGMGFTFVGLLLLSRADSFPHVLMAAACVGMGSSIFHPESSRVARMASGGQHGLAQSIFQVGGNAGTAIGPLLAAAFIMPYGQGSIAWFSAAALLAMVVLAFVGRWSAHQMRPGKRKPAASQAQAHPPGLVRKTMAVLMALVFSKFFYLASINTYLIFYLQHRFGISVQDGQLHLFIFLAAVAAGTLLGGPIGDRIGRKRVIWASILGVAPFTLALPYASLEVSAFLTAIIGFVLASAFPAMVVYAQELMPGKVGAVSGLFFGLAFGLGGIGAAALGQLADVIGIVGVYKVCAFLPLIGLLATFLPDLQAPPAKPKPAAPAAA
ncbi:fosmidomycin efflux system, member of the major facilitator superfamily [Thiomonas sp. X19]|uniref:MFS transporter n=1 Tax=Thiomonas sp. X19 TaxID=1050370 RepID=UPI000B7208A0|nr:MFS transporter [Thiomonas sp. X19]SCC92417.1 fosmidomycin efflux system, member of the major facilitator superfamily [Thiomonas sp. X19]